MATQAADPPTALVKPPIKARATFILPQDGQLSTAWQHQTWCWSIRLPPHKAGCLGKRGYRKWASEPLGREEGSWDSWHPDFIRRLCGIKVSASSRDDFTRCIRLFRNCSGKLTHLPNPALPTTLLRDKTLKVNPQRAVPPLESLSTALGRGTALKLAPTQSQKSFSTHCTELPSLESKCACTHALTKAAVFIWERWYACTE